MLGLAAEWGELDRVPVVKWLKVPEAEFDFLDFEEAERLLAAVEEGEWRAMVLLAIDGASAGRDPRASVDGRGSGGRAPGGPAVRHAGDRDHAEEREVAQDPARSVGADGSQEPPASPGQANLLRGGWPDAHQERVQAPALASLSAGGTSAGGVAHAPAHLREPPRGVRAPIKAVQELLGHASIEMTMRYAHLSPDARRDAVGLLDLAASPGGVSPAAAPGSDV